MRGLFPRPPFIPWCQTNTLLTHPKCNSTDRRIIMDLSWPLPPFIRINGGTPRESYLGSYKKMHLPSAQDFCDLIRTADKGCYLYSADVARAYRQLLLDPGDWPLVCFNFQGAYDIDISLPFGLHWAVPHCQEVTCLITSALNNKGTTVLSYIDDCRRSHKPSHSSHPLHQSQDPPSQGESTRGSS